ncbi:MAG: hypothetical protein GPJ54_13300 [Candidatus Heimdallarchaeota archaeon]|nr:hypothetical protein [Candidatus Heimdallarchaeota archaeon]
MKPQLKSVIATDIKENSTEVELTYLGSELLAGIDLHGANAGLSWLRDKGAALLKHESEERMLPYSITVIVESNCEFRARAYIIDEDYWESYNHKLVRNEDGSISIEIDEAIIEDIEFEAAPPNPFSPHIYSIILQEVKEETSVFEVSYKTGKEVTGIELHGVDADLSWIKGESAEMEFKTDSKYQYFVLLEVKNSIEFKARAYNERGDHWEEGENHKVQRRLDGTIGIVDDFVSEKDFDFVWILPLEQEPSVETAVQRLSLHEEIPPSLFQYLIDTSVWFDRYYQDPLDQDLFDLISRMMRYIREKQREISSRRLDLFVNPIFKALYNLYTSAISFLEDEIDVLKAQWKDDGTVDMFAAIPSKVEKMSSIALNSAEDRELRKRHLWEFN